MSLIQHNIYEDGNVQSLGFKTAEGRDVTVGVMEPGEYDFGVAKRREGIIVLTGEITTPDGRSGSPLAGPISFEVGQAIKFRAASGTSYICYYG